MGSHHHLKLDYGKPTERVVSFATRAERLAAANKALTEKDIENIEKAVARGEIGAV